MLNIAILISGRGSNMQALVQRFAKDRRVNFRLILSDNHKAMGLQFAQKVGMPVRIIDKQKLSEKRFQQQLLQALLTAKVELILLAGFMSILHSNIVQQFPNRIINIHPSLLPNYPGLNTHQRALDDKQPMVGASVHLVDTGVDTGKVLKQVHINVANDDTAQSLAERLLPLEHQLYGDVLEAILNKEISI